MNPCCFWQLSTFSIQAIHLVWNKNHFLNFIIIIHSLQSCTKAHMYSRKQKCSYKLALQKLVVVADLLKGISNATHLVAQGKFLHDANQSIMSIMEMRMTHSGLSNWKRSCHRNPPGQNSTFWLTPTLLSPSPLSVPAGHHCRHHRACVSCAGGLPRPAGSH